MNGKFKNVLKYIIFSALGIGVMIWLYQDSKEEMDKNHIDLFTEFANMDKSWFVLGFFLTTYSNFSRAFRWQIMIESAGYNPKKGNTVLSIMIMYFMNLWIPRSGEVARCSILYKYEKVPVSKMVGTVVVERAFDFLCFFIMVGIMLISQFDFMASYFKTPEFQKTWAEKKELFPILITIGLIGIIGFLAVIILRKRIIKTKIGGKVAGFLQELWEGVKSTKYIKRKWAFLFHTVVIWALYYLVFYISLLAYGPTSTLGHSIAFAVFIMGSLGMIAPSSGGIGAYHAMIILSLVMFGLSQPHALVFAFVSHFMLTMSVIIAGVISMIYLPYYNRSSKLKQ
ncbi:MAG: lysylphosphatidylglycerol synthase transmembrane domain-containing protein [Bacteroidetes bacterium]|nr:lysylphosphatidylglycerol synthase transmembrane domain-containing protein [Bacteroidota bacterium]